MMKPSDHATMLLGAALVFWGWLTGWLAWAGLPGLLLLVQPWVPGRKMWGKHILAGIVMFCIATGAILLVWSVSFQKDEVFVLVLLRLSPLVWIPLALVMAYGTQERWSLESLVLRVRPSLGGEGTLGSPKETWFYGLILFCLLATAAGTESSVWFYPILVLFLVSLLWPFRVRHKGRVHGLVLLASAAVLGYGLGMGLFHLQRSLLEIMPDLLARWLNMDRSNLDHRHTDIGDVGRLKQSDRILFHVFRDGAWTKPLLLKESSYDVYYAGSWSQTQTRFTPVLPGSMPNTWNLDARITATASWRRITVAKSWNQDQGLLPLPAGAVRVGDLDVSMLEKSPFGTVRYRNGAPSGHWTVDHDEKPRGPVPAETFAATDLFVPGSEQAGIQRAFQEAGLAGRTWDSMIQGLQDYFQQRFRYSLDLAESSQFATPLTGFLLGSRRGHCEYFATASVMLLRQGGIPARYVFGYAVSEPEHVAGWYRVRQRDAHAWTSVFVDGAWRDMDFTPPDWRVLEDRDAPFWQPLMDLFPQVGFLYGIMGASETVRRGGAVGGLLILGMFYAVRWIRRNRRLDGDPISDATSVGGSAQGRAGMHSPFAVVVNHLEQSGPAKRPTESLSEWLLHRQHPELLPLLRWHYRWRFDPQGMDAREINRFKKVVGAWMAKRENK
ncbi:MAG: transglutaminase family protein [Magnetococcales bacterium]|nr:transglutaminase family protein [Magnetococcales bacterium]